MLLLFNMNRFKTTCGPNGLATISKTVREYLKLGKGDIVWLEVVEAYDHESGELKYKRGEKI